MEEIKSLIKSHNWNALLDWGKNIRDDEKQDIICRLKEIDIDKKLVTKEDRNLPQPERFQVYYENRRRVQASHYFSMIVCTRTKEDLKLLELDNGFSKASALYLFLRDPAIGIQPLIQFYDFFPPDFLDGFLKSLAKDRFFNADFKILWKLYEKGWIKFEEEFFLRRLFTIYDFNNNHFEDAKFLKEHPDIVKKVFLQFYKYQIPVLDLIKCNSIDYSNGLSAKASVYWTEVFKILIQENVLTERVIVKHLLESLLNNWKKPHLDWHIRILELFKPTKEELLTYQPLLFSNLHSVNPTVVNLSVKCIEVIYKDEAFRNEEFLRSTMSVFVKEKSEKAILKILSIIEFLAKENVAVQSELSTYIPLALLQSDTKIQNQTAKLLLKYTDKKAIEEIVSPYASTLKQEARKILGINSINIQDEVTVQPKEDVEYVKPPSTWEDLLFHIGTCINTQSSTYIDLFFEGLNQLQFEIPSDYIKQIKPYSKKLNSTFWEVYVMIHFEEFINNWIEAGEKYKKADNSESSTIPFLQHKGELLFNKLRKKNNLPFLSTPTHSPYWIHPGKLLERLLAYEKEKCEFDLEDLIVACNRTQLDLLTEEIKAKSLQLKGKYSFALQYFFGVQNEIKLARGLTSFINKISGTDDILPLWTQIARTKDPSGVYNDFLITSAKDYPSVITPFQPTFEINIDKSVYATWHRLKLENNWNVHRYYEREKFNKYPSLFYYTAPFGLARRADILVQLSLAPQYIDTLLCRYIPDTSSGNEVAEFEQCLYAMKGMLESKLRVYHGGWIYVAICLMFEKKVSRDLAADYILLAKEREFLNEQYLAEIIGALISKKFAPVNRLMEYIEKGGNSKDVKRFQLKVLEECVIKAGFDDLPTNFRKLVVSLNELKEELGVQFSNEVGNKLKLYKK